MHLLMHSLWGYIWKHTLEKNQTNATNVTMPLLIQVIWKSTVEKNHINATNVSMPLLRHVIWGDIWKYTAEKNQTNANHVTFPVLKPPAQYLSAVSNYKCHEGQLSPMELVRGELVKWELFYFTCHLSIATGPINGGEGGHRRHLWKNLDLFSSNMIPWYWKLILCHCEGAEKMHFSDNFCHYFLASSDDATCIYWCCMHLVNDFFGVKKNLIPKFVSGHIQS